MKGNDRENGIRPVRGNLGYRAIVPGQGEESKTITPKSGANDFSDNIFRNKPRQPITPTYNRQQSPVKRDISPTQPSNANSNREKETVKEKSPLGVKHIVIVLLALLAAFAPIVNYTLKLSYVYIDNEVYLGFCVHLFWLMIIVALYALVYAGFACALRRKIRIGWTIGFIIVSVFGIFFNFVNYVASTIAFMDTVYIHLAEIAPYAIAIIGVPFLLFLFPLIKSKKRNIIACVVCGVFLLIMAVPVIGQVPLKLKFLSDPVVFDTGTGYYSIVWGVNDDSLGFVTYKYDGVEYSVYSDDDGIKRVDTIHAVLVPREHLHNNSYAIHATRSRAKLAYGGQSGGTIDSKSYSFLGTADLESDDFTVTVASDWHYKINLLEGACSTMEEPDLAFIVGDYADFYVNKRQIIDNVLVGAAKVTKSKIPAIIVRGNHETRLDNVIWAIPELFGFESFYYRVERGNYVYTVLDSGESEPDDHYQRAGYNAFANYLTKELDWLEKMPIVEKGKYHVVLTHDNNYAEVGAIKDRFFEIMEKINVNMTISGHWHRFVLEQKDLPDENVIDYINFVTSGTTGVGKTSFIQFWIKETFYYEASQMEFKGDMVYFTEYKETGASSKLGEYPKIPPNVVKEKNQEAA
ncbi:MAG: metallophosphoesterase [Christensenellaceae bacterium]|jgi:predicted phosphodiesterase|nr:metallophosphoesterase [Christensenellaceae bacterium]